MCTVLLPPGVNQIAINKYIISYFKENQNMSMDFIKNIQYRFHGSSFSDLNRCFMRQVVVLGPKELNTYIHS